MQGQEKKWHIHSAQQQPLHHPVPPESTQYTLEYLPHARHWETGVDKAKSAPGKEFIPLPGGTYVMGWWSDRWVLWEHIDGHITHRVAG